MPQLDTGDSPWPMFYLIKCIYPNRFVVLGQDSKYVYVGRMLNHRDEVIQPLKVRKLAPHIKLLIGLAGTIGSGKSVASELLAKLGAHVKSSHSSVAGLLRYLDIDQSESREALQSAGSFFGVAYPTTWVNRMIRYFNSQEAEVGVWDGVRFPHDIILSRIAAGDYTLDPVSGTYVLKATRFHPVLIDADEKTRESRLGSRKRPREPTKPPRVL